MQTARNVIQVNDEGSITIPAQIVAAWGIAPREKMIIERREDNIILYPSRRRRLERVEELLSIALHGVKPIEIEEGRQDRCF